MVYKLIMMILSFQLLVVGTTYADPVNNDDVYAVMRDIGIKYLISNDRKIPKKDREKWENSLSKFVNFDLMNSGMKERVRSAVENSGKGIIDNDTLVYLQEKAVLFLVPRELSDYTRLYLKVMDEVSKLPICRDGLTPLGGQVFVLCEEALGNSELRIRFINNSEENMSIRFIKTDRWKLSSIETDISERMLMTISRWK